ncbi:hypothetical protein LSH36_160g05071 [Paralvinella palmiformis]|uniref:Carboxylesterase type B domain-containing protein n=1 Tax=Paralvinella palmiformis TaxID=53620 RepID=A0AAD9JU10_9ANNE|nr:hypothetical protein LSH36_160g05071 [Paralvinella palmiformis]
MTYAQYRFINIFQGIPYARAPTVFNNLRFKAPEDIGPRWDIDQAHWCADRYRDACPQELWHLQDKYYDPRNMSEDCLHLNIFAPNITDRPDNRNRDYAVLVFVHGNDFKWGDAVLYPGHILARKEVLVVTFNYRLGALGFLSTLDQYAPGNYGLMDIIKVLEFIQKYITLFRGDPDKVTLVGHDSGAAAIALLLLSPKAKYDNVVGKPLFHQAIMMSGSDLCEWATIEDVWNANAATYARDLGLAAGCGTTEQDLPTQYLVECLRGKSFDDIVNASASVYKRYGSLAGPFGPVVDGPNRILPDTPKNLRESGQFMKMKIISGVTTDEGAYLAENVTKGLPGVNMNFGLDPKVFRQILHAMVRERAAIRNIEETVDAIEFEYTYWAKPDNMSAVRQNLIDMWSDQVYGWCMDAMLKYHACDYSDSRNENCEPVYMYEFAHRSEYETLPFWMGIPHHKDVDYLFGHPFFNESLGNITGLIPEQWDWTYLDRNISEYVQDMWVNFTRYSNPTIDYSRNVTWWPFSMLNLSYIKITEFSYMDINFRQNHYAFWREFYPSISSLWPITTTPQPTPHPLVQYQYATWSLVGAALVAVFIVAALSITLWRRSKSETELY